MRNQHLTRTFFRTLIPGVFLCLCTAGVSGKTIEDFANSTSDNVLYKQTKVHIVKGSKRGEGPGPYLRALDALPAKIGLISVYLLDQGIDDRRVFTPLPSVASHLGEQSANAIATFYARETVNRLKTDLGERGITLLTPSEFAQTDTQQNFYRDFDPKYGMVVKGGMKWLQKLLNTGGSPTMTTAQGYRMFPTDLLFNDKNGGNAMVEIARQMQLDAVMGITLKTRKGKKNVELLEIVVNLYGPNPVPADQRKGLKHLLYEGQSYGSATLQFKGVDLLQYKLKKGKQEIGGTPNATTLITHYEQIATYASIDGLDNITANLVRRLLDEVEARINK